MTKAKQREMEEARKNLRGFIKPSSRINIVITHVSQSGMQRRMKVYSKDMSSNLTYLVGKACDLSEDDRGLKIGGCGMDMAFWLADHITYALGYKNRKTLKGNGGTTIDWKAIY